MAMNRDLTNSNQPQCFLGCIFSFLADSVFSLNLKKKKKSALGVYAHIYTSIKTHTNAHTHIHCLIVAILGKKKKVMNVWRCGTLMGITL